MTVSRTGLLAAALAAGSLAFAAPALARERHGGGDDAAIAIGAGVIGLAIGAAIASDHDDRDRGYYQGSTYNRGYYPAYPRYRAYAYPAYPVYRSYPAYRGYDDRYEQQRRWREHERREHEEREHGGYYGRGW